MVCRSWGVGDGAGPVLGLSPAAGYTACAACEHSSSCALCTSYVHCNKIYVKTTAWGSAQDSVGALNSICLKKEKCFGVWDPGVGRSLIGGDGSHLAGLPCAMRVRPLPDAQQERVQSETREGPASSLRGRTTGLRELQGRKHLRASPGRPVGFSVLQS